MAPQTVLRSLPLDIPVLVPSSYASASTASPTSPTAEDTEKSNGPLDEDALATRTIVLIVLGIAIFACALLAFFLFSRSGSSMQRSLRSSPTAFLRRRAARLIHLSPDVTRGASRPALAPALRGAPFYMPRTSNSIRAVAGRYDYGDASSSSASERTRGSFETYGSAVSWVAVHFAGANAQPPAYSPAAMSGFAVPAHVCAVPAALQGWGTQLLNDAQED